MVQAAQEAACVSTSIFSLTRQVQQDYFANVAHPFFCSARS